MQLSLVYLLLALPWRGEFRFFKLFGEGLLSIYDAGLKKKIRILNFEKALTLIGPGEVKVDLADFDLKLQENLLSTLHIFLTHSCKNVFRIFLNF
jgi:hypothetical protein